MYQLPVNNLSRIRKARKKVKKTLEDIGLQFCKEAAEEFKDFCPDEETVNNALSLDIFSWDPSNSKTQKYRSKTFCCSECSFSSKFYSGYKNHFRHVHRKLLDNGILLSCPYCAFIANRGTLETHVKIFHVPIAASLSYGNPQQILPERKTNPESNSVGHGMKKVIFYCKKCSLRDPLYDAVRRHIYREHFQHVVSPYVSMSPKSKVKNGASSANNILFCKRCQFCARTYEALVQHVLDYHEHIGSQVTTMIGHASVVAPVLYPASVNHKTSSVVDNSQTLRSQLTVQPAVSYLQPAQSIVKNKTTLPMIEMRVPTTGHGTATENGAAGVNTARTQKWKICTVCNELFPENLYSAHFESAHKAKKVWALAKYIMKIHNFTSKCLLCNRYLPSDTLLNHMLVHGLTCPQCHTAFNSVEKIIEHTALAHPEEYVGPPGASPLTFDLTFKQGKSGNIQLAVLTFNMKESTNGQYQAAPIQKNISVPVKLPSTNMIDKPKTFVTLMHNSDVGKTVCPLCFTILKGPISDALAMHLRERHQVIQTLHPVEQKMTYKCIHCLGVYTSNMVASTITLHLVQCRAVGRNQANQGVNSALTVGSSVAGTLKRQQPIQASTNSKRMKVTNVHTSDTCQMSGNASPKSDGLALDPTGYRHKTSKVRRDFLTTYFNRKPYPSSQEMDKLSTSLWVWKADIANHFATMQRLCTRKCRTRRVYVRLGFDMNIVKRYKHNLIFDKGKLVGISTRSPGFRLRTSNNQKYRSFKPVPALKSSTCTETISIDSDTDPETEDAPGETKKADTDDEDVVLVDELMMKEKTTSVEMNVPSNDMVISPQDEKEKESYLPTEMEIPSPLQDEKEVQSPPQDEKETPSPPQDEKETPSPQQDEKETPSPPQDEKESPSPPQDEKESPSPPQDEREIPSPLQDEKKFPCPPQGEKEISSPPQDEKEIPSPQDEKEIPSPPQDEKEIPSPTQDEKVIPSPPQDEKEIPSPQQDEKEIPSPQQDEKEIPSPPQDEKEIPSPQQDEKEIPSPQQDEKEIPSPQQDEKDSGNSKPNERESQSPLQDEEEIEESSLQDVTENAGEKESALQNGEENESSLQDEKPNWISIQGEKKIARHDDDNESSLQGNKENAGVSRLCST
ncbi:activity-dependent neuroprotector homeobox protein [Oryzias latipes]|uniref:Activity-dependent neuroprotector homeobox a n=1 Tax=Oryzias latipes TaxID=8090 RepID=A0A3B3IAU9_ORYLA|nr:activity-dependent neuroprotector homeobox protein [Oryzias latipes]